MPVTRPGFVPAGTAMLTCTALFAPAATLAKLAGLTVA
jgi:hypothetical protein